VRHYLERSQGGVGRGRRDGEVITVIICTANVSGHLAQVVYNKRLLVTPGSVGIDNPRKEMSKCGRVIYATSYTNIWCCDVGHLLTAEMGGRVPGAGVHRRNGGS
jgi:hypothetical protein